MDIPQTNQPALTPNIQVPPVADVSNQPLPTPVTPRKIVIPKATWIILGSLVALILLVMVAMGIKNNNQASSDQIAPTGRPTGMQPTPAPARNLSAIATSSAFMSFTENVSSLSATVNAFTLQDGSFTPPSLDLDIGFTTQ